MNYAFPREASEPARLMEGSAPRTMAADKVGGLVEGDHPYAEPF